MSKHADSRSHMWSPIPYSVLADGRFTDTLGAMHPGSTSLPPKRSTWTTTRGKLSLDEYNAQTSRFTPAVCQEPYRFLDDAWVKENHASELADELYKLDQRTSRNLKDRGAGVTREEIAHIRTVEQIRVAEVAEPVGRP